MKQYHATAVLLAAAMLCTGCAGQGSGASADGPSSAADARTEPAAAETAEAFAYKEESVKKDSSENNSVKKDHGYLLGAFDAVGFGFLANRSTAAFLSFPSGVTRFKFSSTFCEEDSISSSLIRPAFIPLRRK